MANIRPTEHSDPRDLAYVAWCLHHAYTALEAIFERVARALEGGLPDAADWNRQLLDGAFREIEGIRPAILGASAAAPFSRRWRRWFFGFCCIGRLGFGYLEGLLPRIPRTAASVALAAILAGCSATGKPAPGERDTGARDTGVSCEPAAEVANDGIDQDCDGADAVDADLDGSVEGTDCDDADSGKYPGAEEICNGVDDDCDGAADEDLEATSWYADNDGDGYGADDNPVLGCAGPAGFVAAGGDCDDTNPEISPGAVEICDGIDAACDAGDESDVDGDGVRVCDADCDDNDATVLPGTFELCGDAKDNDCDGTTDVDCFECDATVPFSFVTIQEAIDASTAGDVVCVAAGTYAENLDFCGEDITLWGVQGAEGTVIDGGGCCAYIPAVQFVSGESPAAVMRGFTITNAVSDSMGGGMRIINASPTLQDLIITENYAWDYYEEGGGGGIYVSGGSPAITNVVVSDNEGAWSWEGDFFGLGGGIYLHDSDAVIDNVTVEGNLAGNGGGLYLDDSSAVIINTRIADNMALQEGGGGIFLSGSSPALTNVVIAGNQADSAYWRLPDGGGIYSQDSSPVLANVVVTGNLAYGEGGGVYVDGSSPAFTNSVIASNNADSGDEVFISSGALVATWCDVWNVLGDAYVGMDDPAGTNGNLSERPIWLDTAYHLHTRSPLVGAGDPSVLDPDGSTSDIGAYGGPGAGLYDLDGDGWPAWWLPGPYDAATSAGADCDDNDATIFPGSGC